MTSFTEWVYRQAHFTEGGKLPRMAQPPAQQDVVQPRFEPYQSGWPNSQ